MRVRSFGGRRSALGGRYSRLRAVVRHIVVLATEPETSGGLLHEWVLLPASVVVEIYLLRRAGHIILGYKPWLRGWFQCLEGCLGGVPLLHGVSSDRGVA